MNDYWISFRSYRSEFPIDPKDWKFEEHKIRLFKEQIKGWQLNIANFLTQNCPHSDYAILSILLSYFENIGRFWHGDISSEKVSFYFNEGVKEVYRGNKSVITNSNNIYKFARCGIYHIGLTQGFIKIDCYGVESIFIDKNNMLCICPNKLIIDLNSHFDDYIQQLINKSNKQLSNNFGKRFDFLIFGK